MTRERADYKLWAEVEIADLRDDVKRHIEIASFNATESLKWRTLYQKERDENERLRGELAEDVAARIVSEWYDADESGVELIRRVEDWRRSPKQKNNRHN